jgi:cytoskeletal protein CcmA (bactofilin family)
LLMANENALALDERTTQAVTAVEERPALPREERRVAAWIGKSVIFKGDLISSEELTIDGRVEGTIEVRGHGLTIGPDADIRADIVAQTLNVLGAVTGSITAKDKVDIAETGSVEGAILSPRLSMAEGAVVRGQVDVGPRQGAERTESPTR